MKKEQVSHISHDLQQLSLAQPSTAKLPLKSDPVLKNRFESALKLAGSATSVSSLVADKNFSDANYLFADQTLMDVHPFSHGVKKKSTAQPEDKIRHKLSIATKEIADNCCQPYGNMPYTIIANRTTIKAGNNDKLPTSTSKHTQPITHLIHSLADKPQPNHQLKMPFFIDDLSTSQIASQPLKSADLTKPTVISSTGGQIVMTYPARKGQTLSTKKIASVASPDKITDPMEAVVSPEKKTRFAHQEQDKGEWQENSFESFSLKTALSAATTEKMLANVATVNHEKTPASVLNTLFNKLNAVLNVDVNKNYQPPSIQLNLPQIGHLQIKIQHEKQNITIEFVAQTIGQKILLEYRQELIDKLQRIHPDQHIQLVILNNQQSKERSKDQLPQPDDFDEEMV